MDAVLTIDLVLANFAGKTWRALRCDNTYAVKVRQALDDYWKPFFETVAGGWRRSVGASNGWVHAESLCPFLFKP